ACSKTQSIGSEHGRAPQRGAPADRGFRQVTARSNEGSWGKQAMAGSRKAPPARLTRPWEGHPDVLRSLTAVWAVWPRPGRASGSGSGEESPGTEGQGAS